jgi:hypothetical protein
MDASGSERLDATTRKPYTQPKLQVYGDLRSITAHVGNAGASGDPPPHGGYPAPLNKTH